MQQRESQFYLVLRRFLRARLSVVGALIVLLVMIGAIFAPLIAPYEPDNMDFESVLAPPSLTHLLGTDRIGRDIFSRVIYGSRIALKIGLLIILLEASIGVVLGLLAGTLGGVVDSIIMRLVDTFMSFPVLILALAICAILGPGLYNVIIALAIAGWTSFARLVRGEVLNVKENDYIEAAYAIGANSPRIILRYILPNIFSSIIVLATLTMPTALLASASLSFFGLGAQPPTPSWGSMTATGRDFLLSAPWISVAPGAAILLTVLSFNLMGDGLRDALDPKIARGAQ